MMGRGGREVAGSGEVIGLSNFISEFTNLLGTNN